MTSGHPSRHSATVIDSSCTPAGRNIVVGVSGGVAAYKVCEIVSTLAKAEAKVRVVLTADAEKFVTPLTFAALSRHPAYTDAEFWSAHQSRPLHIELGEWADLIVVAPLTAHTLAQIVHGLADNLLTNTILASTCPLLLAPAMNTDMWQQQTVQHNWHQLQTLHRMHTIGPGAGRLACDRVGDGRMAEPAQLISHIQSLLYTHGTSDLTGHHLLISAGGTREYLDPVRFIGNPSTGRMGIALALAAIHRGATVTLVHGPVATADLSAIAGLRRLTPVLAPSASDMHQAMVEALPQANWIIMSAAVADVRPATTHGTKLPKADLPPQLPLAPVADIVAELAQKKAPAQRLIGFAAQTGDIVTPAKEKLHRKQLDAIAANPIDQPNSGFGSHQNQAILLDRQGREWHIPPCSKLELAHRLIDFVHTLAPASP